MPKEDRIRKKARKSLDRAEVFMADERYDRAYKDFLKAGEKYTELREYKVAEQCYYYAARALVHEQKFLDGANAMRDAANSCIHLGNYQKAADYYDVSAKYALKSSKREAEFRSILSSCFAYLCWFLKGQQDKGLAFIKRIKKQVDSREFAENRLTRLVKGLTLAIINRDDSALKVLEEEFIEYKFRESETKLIKDALLLAKTHLLLNFGLDIPEKEVTREDRISFNLFVDISRLKELRDDPYLAHKFKSIKIIDAGVTLSDNLSSKKTPELPMNIEQKRFELEFSARANFAGEGFIGPVIFTLELDERLYFFAKTKSHEISVKSPPAQLGINLKPLTNPIINQTFPMEVKIHNPSDADVSNITIEFELPKGLRLMRGTSRKNIFQLIRNEQFTWQISLKPLEPGEHKIKVTMTFFDQDGKQIGP
ncbi:MAG: hypothetical protein GF364_18845, partial [Candidatus Lokiarchaeota archaeon]|nr:hypothetical protein [Candidatus Lokiarchaeota archaeon]